MFSKYADMEIPKNYSGNRFKQVALNTKMKTHKPPEQPITTPVSVKSAASPSFQELVDRTAKEAQETDLENVKDTYEEHIIEEEKENSRTADDTLTLPVPDKPKASGLDFFSILKSSGIGKLFENKSSDDILLLAIISILSTEGRGENTEIILILALLLLLR